MDARWKRVEEGGRWRWGREARERDQVHDDDDGRRRVCRARNGAWLHLRQAALLPLQREAGPPDRPPASASTVGCQFRFPLAAGQAPAGPGCDDDEEQEREGDFSREGEPCPARAGGPEASDRRQGEREPEEARGRRGCLVSLSCGAEGEGGAGGRGEAEERKGPSGEGKDPGAEGRGGQGKAAARRGEEKVRPAPRASNRGPNSRRSITDPKLSLSLSLSVRVN